MCLIINEGAVIGSKAQAKTESIDRSLLDRNSKNVWEWQLSARNSRDQIIDWICFLIHFF